MIGGIFIYNARGGCIVSKIFRPEMYPGAVDIFRVCVIHARKDVQLPINTIANITFFHKKRGTMWVVAATRRNVNAALVFEYLDKITKIMESYFYVMTNDSLKNNFLLVYEMLEETMDYGYPQNTNASMIRPFVTQKSLRMTQKKNLAKITSQITGQIGWRREGIKYRRHELYLDVVEYVNLLMSSKGTVLNNHVTGKVNMKSYLSGMPECKFGLNDKLTVDPSSKFTKLNVNEWDRHHNLVAIDDTQFHQCVKLNNYQTDRSITFIPPDGSFELMRYRITNNISLPFRIIPLLRDVGRGKMELKLTLKSNYKTFTFGEKIVVTVPTPENAINVKAATHKGRAKYKPAENAVLWKITRMSGMKDAQLTVVHERPHEFGDKNWRQPPLSLNFEIPFSASGFDVRYLKVFEPKQNYSDRDIIKWVKYTSYSGNYEFRC